MIKQHETTAEETTLEQAKAAPAELHLHEIIGRRWSPRSFADREIPAADLKKIFDATRYAASSYNEQPWRFLVGRRGDATYQKILDCLMEFNQGWAKSAPVLILSATKKTFSHNKNVNGYAMHDVGAATATLMLQATALGLHTHGMAGFDKDKAREAFQIPEDFEIGAVTALGYLGDTGALPEKMQEQETAARTRKPLAEVVYSEWGKAAEFGGE